MAGPLDGVRIVDLSSVVLGPYATQILGDLGADIIKIESPSGDFSRAGLPGPKDPGMNALYMSVNRNKRNIVLDLGDEEDKEILRELIRSADVFFHNVRAAGMERLGFHYDAVKEVKPDIIYAHACGYGSEGPYAGLQAFDDMIQAASGAMTLVPEMMEDDEPRFIPTIVADKTTGLHAAYAILAALFHKERTGEGQFVEIPMLEVMASNIYVEHLGGAQFDPPHGKRGHRRTLSPRNKAWKTKDGHIVIIAQKGSDWFRFFSAAGRDDISKDERFADSKSMVKNSIAFREVIAEVAETMTTQEWLDALAEAHVPAMRVNSYLNFEEDPHLKAVGILESREHPTEGGYQTIKSPIKFEKTPASFRHHPPKPNAQGEEILREAGVKDEVIAAFNKRRRQ